MIEITRDDTTVIFTVKGEWPVGGHEFAGRYLCGSTWAAALLWEHLRTRMSNELQRIRRDAYAQGWKDAKAHAPKRTWFSSMWKD